MCLASLPGDSEARSDVRTTGLEDSERGALVGRTEPVHPLDMTCQIVKTSKVSSSEFFIIGSPAFTLLPAIESMLNTCLLNK